MSQNRDILYNKNIESTSHKDMFMISELVREKIIRMLGDELPHDTFVQVELFEEEEALIKIHAVIFVARNSQKQIVIGKGGNTLKKIGQQARIEIEGYFDKKVFLKNLNDLVMFGSFILIISSCFQDEKNQTALEESSIDGNVFFISRTIIIHPKKIKKKNNKCKR